MSSGSDWGYQGPGVCAGVAGSPAHASNGRATPIREIPADESTSRRPTLYGMTPTPVSLTEAALVSGICQQTSDLAQGDSVLRIASWKRACSGHGRGIQLESWTGWVIG